MDTFDVIVVGAGTGGSVAAYFAAKNGLNVCLVERKPYTLEPAKVCGDAVGSEVFDLLGIAHPSDQELSCHIKGVKLYSPDLKKCFTIIDPKIAGYVVNRQKFGQRLLKEALDAGVSHCLFKTKAVDLIYDNGTVTGVITRSESGEVGRYFAKVVIDASGLFSTLRKKIKSRWVENDYENKDVILCFREIIHFSAHTQKVNDPEYITIILDQERAPGGYIWYFPKNEYALNIGLGGFMDMGRKVREYYKKYVYNVFTGSGPTEILSSGGGIVPVRRPLWSCAENGIMFAGDAAMHVNPLHGGGIDPSMRAGHLAAMTAVKAIGKNDHSLHTLWEYNVAIMRGFGSEFAGLDLLRRVMQSLSNEDLNFGLKKDLLSGPEILAIAKTGAFRLSLRAAATRFARGISRPRFLWRLNYLRRRMNKIVTLYRNFPVTYDQEKFEAWKLNVKKEYEKTNKIIAGN